MSPPPSQKDQGFIVALGFVSHFEKPQEKNPNLHFLTTQSADDWIKNLKLQEHGKMEEVEA